MASARPGNRLTWNMARRNRRGMMYQGGRCGIAIAIGLIPFSNRLYMLELLIPDTRVNVRIENIHHQVSHGEDGGEDDDNGLHHLEIPGSDCIHDQQSSTR